MILDGHHRTQALMALGCRKIPVYLIDYYDSQVRVVSRRPNYIVSKDSVINRALANDPYPAKTSRHFIPHRPKNFKIKLSKLK